jgi:hypothetical protein
MCTAGIRCEPRATFPEDFNILSRERRAGFVLDFFGRWPAICGIIECSKITPDHHESVHETAK